MRNVTWERGLVTEVPGRVGPYAVLSKVGQGGMGVVYRAEDERLHRPVALKIIPCNPEDAAGTRRFWQEARATAHVTHPNACRLYDIVEEPGSLVLVMEFLEGESLAVRIQRGPIPAQEAAQITLAILSALGAFHKAGIVHRDLKPGNIFLSTHGTKILDFGLAKHYAVVSADGDSTLSDTASGGFFLGTPRYASPEQFRSEAVDGRSDLFSVGAILYEMLTGRRAFPGESFGDIAHSVLYTSPAALTGSPAVCAMGRIIHKGLARNPAERYATAEAMAAELRASLLLEGIDSAVRALPQRRLMVLPFRLLRPAAEVEFLAYSLPEAITMSLAGFDGLIVRSSITAAQYSPDVPDLKKIASEAEVDLVLTGALLALGDELRVTTQLVEVPAGTLVWSYGSQATTRDLLKLHDELVGKVVESLLPSITPVEREALQHDRPASPSVYELYLRANEVARGWNNLPAAIELYERCLQHDPSYAPAWVRLGRARFLLDKYEVGSPEGWRSADEAFQKAFALRPNLAMAHSFYTNLEVDLGRTLDALRRLLKRAQHRRSEAALYAGLAHVCRYCGLLRAALAAHHEATRLDPKIATSISHTYFMLGDYERALEASTSDFGYAKGVCLSALGRFAEATDFLRETERGVLPKFGGLYVTSLRALLEDNREESLRASESLRQAAFRDPEGKYYLARQIAYLQEQEEALNVLERAIEGGFFCYPAMATDAWLDPLRGTKRFAELLRAARDKTREAEEIYLSYGGASLLGVSA